MPRTRVEIIGSALKVMVQVGASMGATLIAAIAFASLPKATVPADRPAAELTSGGKFAARIPDAEDAASDKPARARFALPLRSAAQGSFDAVAGGAKLPASPADAALASSPPSPASVGVGGKQEDGAIAPLSSAARTLLSAAAGAGVPSLPHVAP